jgi:hypothetical protein
MIQMRPKGRKSTNRSTATNDSKFLSSIENKGRKCKVLLGKDQKKAEVH